MTKPIQSSNAHQLFLLCSIVSFCHSLFVICDHFLSSHDLSMLATLVSLTCIFLVTLHCLQMNTAYQSVYWNYFLLMSAFLSTTDSSLWNFLTGFGSMLMGFTFLSLYAVYFQCRKWKGSSQGQEEQRPGNQSLPLIVEVAFVFIGNGIAIMGRWFIPNEKFAWIFSAGAIFFLLSAIFLYCYYKYSATAESDSDIIHSHSE